MPSSSPSATAAAPSRFAGITAPAVEILSWWGETHRTWRLDLVAGLTLWGMVVPEAIAYSGLAGVPPLSGVWGIVFALPFYVLFGTSRHLVASPTSAASVTAGSIIVGLGLTDPQSALPGIAAITLCVGIAFGLMWVFKLGFFVNFISKPINAGFMFGLALFIIISQVPKVFGIKGGGDNAIDRIVHIVGHLGELNLTTTGLAVLGLLLLGLLPRLSPKIPAGLVMLVVLTLCVQFLALDTGMNVDVVGALQSGPPQWVLPVFSVRDWVFIFVGALGIVLLAFSEASSVAQKLADEHGHIYRPEQDLFAFSMGNLAAGLFGGLPAAGSMSSTSTNEAAGAKTQLSTLVTAVAALLTALYFGGLLAKVPEAALGILIIHAVWHNLSLTAVRRIAKYSKQEAEIAILAAVGVLVLDVLYGLLLAMIVSLLWYLGVTTKVSYLTLGIAKDDPGTLVPDGVPAYSPLPDGVFGIRFSSPLFYGNIDDAIGVVQQQANQESSAYPDARHVALIDFISQRTLDYTSAGELHQMFGRLRSMGFTVVLVGVNSAVFDSLTEYASLPDDVVTVESSAVSMAMGLVHPETPDKSTHAVLEAITKDAPAARKALHDEMTDHPGAAKKVIDEACEPDD